MISNFPKGIGYMLIYYSEQIVIKLVRLSTGINSESLVSSAIKDGWSMFAMFLTILHVVEGLDTETLK